MTIFSLIEGHRVFERGAHKTGKEGLLAVIATSPWGGLSRRGEGRVAALISLNTHLMILNPPHSCINLPPFLWL